MTIESALDALRSALARDVTTSLNNAVRRLRHAESRDEWIRTLNETSSQFCQKAIFFPIGTRGLLIHGMDVPLASSPAVAHAVESKDTVISAATAKELSESIALELGEAQRVWIVPVLVRDSAVGVLCAVPGQHDVSSIELLASLASASVVAAPEKTVESKPAELVRIVGVPEAPPKTQTTPRPEWSDLGKGDQATHLRAQRFARSRIAEIVLNRSEAVRRGRTSGNLYTTLREEIDEGRDAFRREFIDTCPSMVDYFHLELVRTVAKDDSHALGPDYPGPLP